MLSEVNITGPGSSNSIEYNIVVLRNTIIYSQVKLQGVCSFHIKSKKARIYKFF